MSTMQPAKWQTNSSSLASPLPARSAHATRKPTDSDGPLWRLATRISPSLRHPTQQKRLGSDLLWIGLLLGMGSLWCLDANLQTGQGVNLLIVTLAALSALTLFSGLGLERRAVRNGWRHPR